MNTVQKNNNITRKQVQELLEENQEKLRLSDKSLKKLIKSMRSHTISRQMRKVFYQECLKKLERKEGIVEGKFKHLTKEDIKLLEDNINNIPRDILGGKTPYELTKEKFPELIKRIGSNYIQPDDVTLNKKYIIGGENHE